jgi:hypothetical protein
LWLILIPLLPQRRGRLDVKLETASPAVNHDAVFPARRF